MQCFSIQIMHKHISVQQLDIKFVDVRLTSVDYGSLNLDHGIVRGLTID